MSESYISSETWGTIEGLKMSETMVETNHRTVEMRKRLAALASKLELLREGGFDAMFPLIAKLYLALEDAEIGLRAAGADKTVPKGSYFVPTPTLAILSVRQAMAEVP